MLFVTLWSLKAFNMPFNVSLVRNKSENVSMRIMILTAQLARIAQRKRLLKKLGSRLLLGASRSYILKTKKKDV